MALQPLASASKLKHEADALTRQIVMMTGPACYDGAVATPADNAFFAEGGAWRKQDARRRHCF
jgi:hypothetical protein